MAGEPGEILTRVLDERITDGEYAGMTRREAMITRAVNAMIYGDDRPSALLQQMLHAEETMSAAVGVAMERVLALFWAAMEAIITDENLETKPAAEQLRIDIMSDVERRVAAGYLDATRKKAR